MLFVYNCNPLATAPDQNRVLQGLERDDLFTVVFEQVYTDTARYADVVLPATTFLEHYDIAKAYGPITLQLVRPVIEPVGEARTNADGVLASWPNAWASARAEDEAETLMRITGAHEARRRRRSCCEQGVGDAAARRRADPVRRRLPADGGPEGPPVPGGDRRRRAARALRLPGRSGDRRAFRSR